jgi:hypothetical protein
MNTKSSTTTNESPNANTSGMSEIRELTDGELEAANGGKGSGGASSALLRNCAGGKHYDKVTIELW